jgi:hypothetical protein
MPVEGQEAGLGEYAGGEAIDDGVPSIMTRT